MKHDSKGHRKSNLTNEQLIKAVEECHDKSASDIAHHMGGYDRSTISRHLKELERDGIVTHRVVRGAGGMLALWSVDCFTKFDAGSEKCKCCPCAVECYAASESTKVSST